jgi:predicted phosphoadenosine phosphosulfate sulfurtransferase
VRPLPNCAETQVATYNRDIEVETGVADAFNRLWTAKDGKICVVTGIRTEESLRRYRTVARLGEDNYINVVPKGKGNNVFSAHPIYDWRSSDVWLAVKRLNWDYNRTYDIFNLTNLHGKYLHQRVCPPFGEEPLRGFNLYQECFPDMWAKMCLRVAGVGSAVRYSNDELYGASLTRKPDGMTWKDYLHVVLQSYNPTEYELIIKQVNENIALHYRKSILPLEDEDPDPISGASWYFYCKVALKGDFKMRWLGNINNNAPRSKRAKGISFDEIVNLYGTSSFKSAWYQKSARINGVLDTPQPD